MNQQQFLNSINFYRLDSQGRVVGVKGKCKAGDFRK